MLMASSFLLPLFLIAFACSHSLPVSCLILLMIGLLQSVLHAMATTLVQVNVPDGVRGRVMSLYGTLIIGAPKMAGVLIGGVAEYLGLPLTISLGSLLAFLYVLGVRMFLPSVRHLD
jgi:sugar phosphate permease